MSQDDDSRRAGPTPEGGPAPDQGRKDEPPALIGDPEMPVDVEPKGGARSAGRAVFAMVSRSLQQISTFIITLLAARFMLPAEYGVYTLAVVFVTLIQTLTFTGFYQYIIVSKEEDATILSTTFWLVTGLGFGSSLLLIACAQPIAWVYAAPDLFLALVFLAMVQPIASAGAWSSAVLLRRQMIMTHFSIMFAQNLVALVGGVVLLWLWQSLWALVAFRWLRVLTGAVLYFFLVPDRPGFRFNRRIARAASSFSGGLYAARFLNFLSRYGADLLLGLMFTTAEAGLYRFGSRVASGATDIVSQPMSSFALTQFGAANRKDRDLAPVLRRFAGATVILTGGVAAVIIVLAQEVVTEFFHPAYAEAIVVTYALAIRAVASVGSLLLEPLLSARHMTRLTMTYNLVWAVVTVVAVFLAAPYGLQVLAWSQAGVTLASTMAAFVLIQRRAGVNARPGVRGYLVASGIILVYGAALWATWQAVLSLGLQPLPSVGLGLGLAAIMGLLTLLVGRKAGVFDLRVFSG